MISLGKLIKFDFRATSKNLLRRVGKSVAEFYNNCGCEIEGAVLSLTTTYLATHYLIPIASIPIAIGSAVWGYYHAKEGCDFLNPIAGTIAYAASGTAIVIPVIAVISFSPVPYNPTNDAMNLLNERPWIIGERYDVLDKNGNIFTLSTTGGKETPTGTHMINAAVKWRDYPPQVKAVMFLMGEKSTNESSFTLERPGTYETEKRGFNKQLAMKQQVSFENNGLK